MARREEIERAILKDRFPAYTEHVRNIIIHNQDQVSSPHVLQQIWDKHRPSLRHFGASFDDTQKSDYRKGIASEATFAAISRYMADAHKLDVRLNTLSEEDLIAELAIVRRKKQREQTERAAERDKLAWFNLPDCATDEEYWRGIYRFSADQAVALVLGKDPRKVNAEELQPFTKVSRSLFTEKYGRLLASIKTFSRKQGESDDFSRQEVEAWAKQHGLSFTLSPGSSNAEVAHTESKLDPREALSLYKILVGISKKRYGFDPTTMDKQEIRRCSKEIHDDLISAGFSIDQKSVFKHLETARLRVAESKNSPYSIEITA